MSGAYPARGHMPFPVHRTQAEVRLDEERREEMREAAERSYRKAPRQKPEAVFGDWQDQARAGTRNLLSAIEDAGVRP